VFVLDDLKSQITIRTWRKWVLYVTVPEIVFNFRVIFLNKLLLLFLLKVALNMISLTFKRMIK